MLDRTDTIKSNHKPSCHSIQRIHILKLEESVGKFYTVLNPWIFLTSCHKLSANTNKKFIVSFNNVGIIYKIDSLASN
jgi:hypothetical protein